MKNNEFFFGFSETISFWMKHFHDSNYIITEIIIIKHFKKVNYGKFTR